MSEFRTNGISNVDDPANDSNSAFNFDNCRRNAMILNDDSGKGKPQFKVQKTGTTIVGLIYKDGIVLGADTRATGGSTVMDKNCEKIHYMAPNIYCCGAGTAADTENVTGLISSQLELLRLNTGTESRVVTAMTLLKRQLFRYQGHISAALVLGGVDHTGFHLYSVYPHGSTDKLPYVTMGSGSLAAMAMFECGYTDDMEESQAKQLVVDAIMSGIMNDLGSGSNVDLTTISRVNGEVKVKIERNLYKPNEVDVLRNRIPTRNELLKIPRGSTAVLRSKFENLVVEEVTPMQF